MRGFDHFRMALAVALAKSATLSVRARRSRGPHYEPTGILNRGNGAGARRAAERELRRQVWLQFWYRDAPRTQVRSRQMRRAMARAAA